MSNRIKGQEASLGFTSPSGDVTGFDDVLSFSSESILEILEEEYLGQTAKQYDSIYHGEEGTAEFHLSTLDWLALEELIISRAQRRTAAGGVFSATVAYKFPDGFQARITFEDIQFGAIPKNVDTRSGYVKLSLTWKCSGATRTQ